MKTINLNASQLPVDASPSRIVWRVETYGDDIHFILEGKTLTAEAHEVPQTEEDFQRDLRVEKLPLLKAAELVAPYIDGDFWNTNNNRFLGLFKKA